MSDLLSQLAAGATGSVGDPSLPSFICAGVFLGALLEFVFPPFFGDTVILLGFFLAGRGQVGGAPVFAAALLGSVAGACGSYALGRRFHRAPLGAGFLLTSERRTRIASWFGRHGTRALLVNRFLPGIRAFFLFFAGIGRMDFRQVLVWSTCGSVLWCAFLMWLGLGAGRSWGEIAAHAREWIRLVGILALLGCVLALAGMWVLSRARR